MGRLRGHLPHIKSILMDRRTLLSHRDHWSNESSPTRRALPHLTDAEQSLYQDLIHDVYGMGVRLEQERVRFSWVHDAHEREALQEGGPLATGSVFSPRIKLTTRRGTLRDTGGDPTFSIHTLARRRGL